MTAHRRADLTAGDLFIVLWSNASPVRATAEVAPDAWRRGIAFLLAKPAPR